MRRHFAAGLALSVILTAGLLYALHPALYRTLWERCRPPAILIPSPPPSKADPIVEERNDTSGATTGTADPPPPDVIEYSPSGPSRVRVLHPQTTEALGRLRADAQSDPDLLSTIYPLRGADRAPRRRRS